MNKFKLWQIVITVILFGVYLYLDKSVGAEYTDPVKTNNSVISIFGKETKIKTIGVKIYKGKEGKTVVADLYISGEKEKGFVNAKYLKIEGNNPLLVELMLKTTLTNYKKMWTKDEGQVDIDLDQNLYYLEVAWRIAIVLFLLVIAYLVKKYSDIALGILLLRTKFTPKIFQTIFDENFVCLLLMLCIFVITNDLVRLFA